MGKQPTDSPVPDVDAFKTIESIYPTITDNYYPLTTPSYTPPFILQDDSDDQGPYIAIWNDKKNKPSKAQMGNSVGNKNGKS